MTVTYLAYVAPIKSMWVDGFTPCSAAAMLDMDEVDVAIAFAELDDELVREQALDLDAVATSTYDPHYERNLDNYLAYKDCTEVF